jgi:putative polyketide hydroxylase
MIGLNRSSSAVLTAQSVNSKDILESRSFENSRHGGMAAATPKSMARTLDCQGGAKVSEGAAQDAHREVDTPVLIAGCGPAGLVTSILLSRQGIPNVIIEKRDRVSVLPRSRGITSRTMEIFDQFGLSEEVASFALPPLWTGNFVYTETLGGDLVGVMPSSSMAPGASAAFTASDYKVATQDLIDPMLHRLAASRPEASARMNTELIDFVDEGNAIVSTLRHLDGTCSQIRSRYLVAADGGRSPLREKAGIGIVLGGLHYSIVNCQFRADLSRFTKGREGTLIWTLAPGAHGVFHNLDGDKMWIVRIHFDPKTQSPESWTKEQIIRKIRVMIGSDDVSEAEFDVLRHYVFDLTIAISERLRKGRLLLVGDAAHQIMPHGGFGMNTGVQTAHNLAWKLAAVLRGEATEALLDTFDLERREVAERVCAFSKTNAGYIERMKEALNSSTTTEQRNRVVAESKQYGNWLGLDLGVHYKYPGAFIADDVLPPETDDPIIDFVPHAKPGYRAPHMWVRRSGERLSTVRLFDGEFVLLCGTEGGSWIASAKQIENPGIKAYRVASDGDLQPEGDFAKLYGISSSGSVLVRPDGHVGFRAPSSVGDPVAVLQRAMDAILQRGSLASQACSKQSSSKPCDAVSGY